MARGSPELTKPSKPLAIAVVQLEIAITRASVVAMLFLATLAYPVYAAKHPVPLDKGVKEDICLQCHSDLTEGKNVHPAVQMGCFTCHFVRGSGDRTHVVLKTPKTTSLCTTCHDDKKAGPSQHLHPPAAKDCVVCHEPHSSPNKSLLKKAESGGKGSNLCLQCHTQGLNVPDKGSRHPALDTGCDTCHNTHKSGNPSQAEFRFHLVKAPPALCMDCHDVKDKDLIVVHKGQPFGTADCTTCHDPHQSKVPHLMQANLHPPFADGTCDVCHAPAENGKVKLNQPQVNDVCGTCHGDVVEQISKVKVPHPGAQGNCTDCHNPHAGRYPRFLNPDPVTLCENCHSDQATALNTKIATHDPATRRCSICHMPHGGDNAKLLRAKGNDLCLTCHAADAKGLKVPGSDEVGIFSGSVLLPGDYITNAEHLKLIDGRGHPVARHPISGPDPSNPMRQISCESCHDPHAGDTSNLLVVPGFSTAPLCSQCHTKMN